MDLISLLVVVIILGLLIYAVGLLPLPRPFKTVAHVIVVLIAIIYLLGMLGYGPGVNLRIR
jgi:heme A synthase